MKKFSLILYKFIISISLFSVSIPAVYSQQSTDYKVLITKSINYLEKSCISMDFKVGIKEKNNVNSQSIFGKLKISGQKFHLQTDEMQIWYNGKIQWAYSKSTNEVSVSIPQKDEIASVNPLVVLKTIRDNGKLSASTRRGIKGTGIRIIPAKGSLNTASLDLDIDQHSGKILQLWMTDLSGSESKMEFVNQKKIECNSTNFEFTRSIFPKATINDLR